MITTICWNFKSTYTNFMSMWKLAWLQINFIMRACEDYGPNGVQVIKDFICIFTYAYQIFFSLTWLVSLPPETAILKPHVSGCARCEGYYKINPMDKKAYLQPSFATPTPCKEASKRKVIICWCDTQKINQLKIFLS